MEAAFFIDKRSLKAEVDFLHLVADTYKLFYGILGFFQAAVHQGGIRRPVGVVHNVVEDIFHFKSSATFFCFQNAGTNCKRAGNLDAVDAGHRVCLFNGENLGTLLAGRDGSHESGAAAANYANINIIGLIAASSCCDALCEPCFLVAACLCNTVGNCLFDSAGRVGSAGNRIQATGLILDDCRDQLILNHGEENRGLILGDDLNIGQSCFTEGAFHCDIAQVAVCRRLIFAGFVGCAVSKCKSAAHSECCREPQACCCRALQKLAAGDFFFRHFCNPSFSIKFCYLYLLTQKKIN